MPRFARIVIPQVAHHVTQRGNRRLPIFFSDDDRRAYLSLIALACQDKGTDCLAWCLMENHVHLILVPQTADGLRATLGEAHRRYTMHVNKREGWSGYLFQGRFASYPMDDAHLVAAIRYVENNPVKAGLVEQASDWSWSSARSHVAGKRVVGDPLTNVAVIGRHISNWQSYLARGAEAADDPVARDIEARTRTGRPLASEEWIAAAEAASGRRLGPARRGRKPNSGTQY